MNVSDFHYELPEHLIAQYPPTERSASRLLTVHTQDHYTDGFIVDMLDQLHCGDLLVLNNTKVIPARLFGRKETGGQIEVLLERIVAHNRFVAQIRASRSPKVGTKLYIDNDDSVTLSVVGRQGVFFEIVMEQEQSLVDWFEIVGHMPLPPYIERADEEGDMDRYQTVYAQELGAVAAPTAGLHYDQALLDRIEAKGIQIRTITLHVGAGTYQPVRVENISDHVMHSEYLEVDQGICDAIIQTKAAGNKVVAVGTTVVRSLETAAHQATSQLIEPYCGDTDIFITPGFEFKVVDMLQTNFHLPESTLLMLVSAFAGHDCIMRAYQHAVAQQYRFFSYGDAMLLSKTT